MARLALLLLVACATAPPPAPPPPVPAPPVDPLAAATLIQHVTALVALDGRLAGTPSEWAAARYAAKQLAPLPVHELAIPAMYSVNVYAIIPGKVTDQLVVIGAHLDHLGRRGGVLYPGADDNASGVAVVLGVARALAQHRESLQRSILVVFFGAEELGMLGSQAFVAAPPMPRAQLVAMVNVDMIGRPLLDQPQFQESLRALGYAPEHAVGLVGARRYPALRAIANAAFAPDRVVASEDFPHVVAHLIDRQTDGRGDQVPFEAAGIPGLFFGDGESTDYHQPTDTLDKVTPALLEVRARALLRVVVELSRAPAAAFAPAE